MRYARQSILTLLATACAIGFLSLAPAAVNSQDDWLVFESSEVRFKHPKGTMITKFDKPGEFPHSWTVNEGSREIFSISRYRDGTEKRPLSAAAKHFAYGMKIFSGPTKLALPGGECLRFRKDSRVRPCEGPRTYEGPTKSDICIAAFAEAACYNNKKTFFKIISAESWYKQQGKPDAETLKEWRTFDAILKSLQFK